MNVYVLQTALQLAKRGVEVKLSRRNGVIKTFTLHGKLGRDTPVTGSLRSRAQGREVLYLETKDAGAFFRFTDIYPKMFGGQMWVAHDAPNVAEPQKRSYTLIPPLTAPEKAHDHHAAPVVANPVAPGPVVAPKPPKPNPNCDPPFTIDAATGSIRYKGRVYSWTGSSTICCDKNFDLVLTKTKDAAACE